MRNKKDREKEKSLNDSSVEGYEKNNDLNSHTSSIADSSEINNPPNKEISEMGRKALIYLEKGFSIFPLWAKSKTPILSEKTWHCTWSEYQKRLPTVEEVTTWWTKWEDANIGIATGEISGIIVLDLDGKEAEEYLKEHGFELPLTPYVKTGKGYHYYLKHPKDGNSYKNFARGKIKIDLRGDGGYVVAPPSIHPDGGKYEWEIDVEQQELSEIPHWLIDMMSKKEDKRTEKKHHIHEEEEDTEFPTSDFGKVVQGCAFIRHCVEDAETLPEPEWHSALSIAIFCEDGEEKGHEISEPYNGYSFEETQKKIDKLRNYGPKTCEKIQEEHGDFYCKGCPKFEKDSSPITFGYPSKVEKAKKTLEEAFRKAEKSDNDESIVTDSEVIGSLAVIRERDASSYKQYEERYQSKFNIGKAKLKNLISQWKGEEMGKLVEHPSTKLDEEQKILSLLQINEEEYNFFVWEGQGDQRYPKRISNFLLEPIYSLLDSDGNYKNVVKVYTNKIDKPITIIVDSKSMTSNSDFKNLMSQKANLSWTGKPLHLDWLYEYIQNHEKPTVHYIEYVGYNRENKCWIFPTHAFINGQVYRADENGLIHAEGKIFKVLDNKMFNLVKQVVEKDAAKENIQEYFDDFYKLYGYQGLLGMGWIVAGLQVHMFEQKMDSPQFPFFYATGIFQSGKTQFMRRLYELAGMKGKFDTNPTKDIWRKSVKAFSNLPLVFDEVRDTGKNGFFNQMREVINKTFDRDDHKRGTIDPNAPLIYPTQSIVGFSGEIPTEDSAIMSRTIFAHSTKFTKDIKAFNRLSRANWVANWIGQHLQRTSNDWAPLIFQFFETELEEMDEFSIDSRELTNYALCMAGFEIFLTTFLNGDYAYLISDLREYIKTAGEASKMETRDSHPSIQYLISLGNLTRGDFPTLVEKEHYLLAQEFNPETGKDENVLYMIGSYCFQTYQRNAKDWDSFYNTHTKVKKDLETYKFFSTKSKRVGSRPDKNAWRINLDHPDLSEEVRNAFIIADEGNDPY